jgi:hypothetical protein
MIFRTERNLEEEERDMAQVSAEREFAEISENELVAAECNVIIRRGSRRERSMEVLVDRFCEHQR